MQKKKTITKKNITKKIKKKIIKKKATTKKNTKSSKITKKSSIKSNPLELIFKENESQLISLITKEFDKEYHPDLDDLKYIPESGGEFTVDFTRKEHRQGVAWAMTQYEVLQGDERGYFNGKVLDTEKLPVPEGKSGAEYWGSEAGKASLAYFSAGLTNKISLIMPEKRM